MARNDDDKRPPTADELFQEQVRRVRALLDDNRKGREHTPEARLQAEAMLTVALAIKCHSGAITGSGIASGLGSALGGLLGNISRRDIGGFEVNPADGLDELLGRKRPGGAGSPPLLAPGSYRATAGGSLVCCSCRAVYPFATGDTVLVSKGTTLTVNPLFIGGREQLHAKDCARSGYTGHVLLLSPLL